MIDRGYAELVSPAADVATPVVVRADSVEAPAAEPFKPKSKRKKHSLESKATLPVLIRGEADTLRGKSWE